ncbi:cyanocobalamin reductase / alkylcobalamin dealkylase isoform X1 [Pundamilia nyererei]|uniref:Cyanocobalamin reductase / alkylcobalamin dealkylase n=1 Tax=Pundamilia nyererei TaxID=303518 RepID=A0A3B4FIB5_9CICH|nr:PREDICTED: methylmalonic aciduria and homocystinuria type C protein isoform X1 [Pundamilia nyererei]
MAASNVSVENVRRLLNDSLTNLGFEVYPLKIGWYNSVLPPTLHLSYPDDTLAVVVLSTPAMFEDAFLPFLEQRCYQGLNDPIDQCVRQCITSAVSQCFPGEKVDVRYDYELLPSRKPKFLAQTAAHVSGAAFYYQKADVTEQPWAEKKMFGVCVHPRFGGWFAIRALLVFGDVTVGSELVQPVPPDCVPSREGRIKLLEAFNFHWQDWSYRNIISPIQTYSQKQRDYFSTPPAQRVALLRAWGYLPSDNNQPEPTSDTQSQEIGHG